MLETAIDRIYDDVINNLKTKGTFDEIRVDLMKSLWNSSGFQTIIDDFKEQCKEFCAKSDLNQDRKDLRAALDRDAEAGIISNKMLKECISVEIEAKHQDVKRKFYEHAKAYLIKELQKPESEDEAEEVDNFDNVDMEIDNQALDEDSPIAPPYSPIDDSIDLLDIPLKTEANLEECNVEPEQPTVKSEVEAVKSREPIVDNKEPIVDSKELEVKTEGPAAKLREPIIESREPKLKPEEPIIKPEEPVVESMEPMDDSGSMTLSDVSSVHTADLSDFDGNINLSDDEANIMGQSRVKIEDLQEKLQTRCESARVVDANASLETSISDSCGSRRASRQRKSNPRYNNEHFTL